MVRLRHCHTACLVLWLNGQHWLRLELTLCQQVLFKRKPVQFLPPAVVEDEDEEVWHIPQTGEIFTSYEEYLNR